MAEVKTNTPHFIDYSQWSLWDKCEWAWFERYVQQYQRRRREGEQRDDALTLGTLVHSGLESYRSVGRPEIPPEVVTGANASYSCYEQANTLLAGYILRYPAESFALNRVETALRFSTDGPVDGLAKVDNYFRLDKPTEVESGLGFGEADGASPTFTLTPGWWIREYKTKDVTRDKGSYIAHWRMHMQANFQMLALEALIGEPVSGMLVDIIEKPAPYVPKHTCKGCKAQIKRSEWVGVGSEWQCPACGNTQPLTLTDKSKVERKPSYYRIAVSRTQAVLARARTEIREAGERMLTLREGLSTPSRSTDRCFDMYGKQCEYFTAHAEDYGARAFPADFVPLDALAYIKL